MKRKGFTLIELLAVIVILAIISLIATPVIFKVIENSKKAAAERSVESIKSAAELYYMNNRDVNGFSGVMFICDNSGCKSGDKILEINGTLPDSGTISISRDGTVVLNNIVIDGYNVSNSIESGTNVLVENNSIVEISDAKGGKLLNYKIFGHEDGLGSYNLVSTKSDLTGSGDACDGHNCLYYASASTSYNKFTIDDNGIVTSTGASLVGFIVDVEPNTTYTASFNITQANGTISMRVREFKDKPSKYEGDINFIKETFSNKYMGTGVQSNEFTTDSETEYALFIMWLPSTGCQVKDLQLELGGIPENGTMQPYIPYGYTHIPMTVTGKSEPYDIQISKPLTCNGDVCDYLDYATKTVYRYDGSIEKVDLPDITIPEGNSTITIGTKVKPTKINLIYE